MTYQPKTAPYAHQTEARSRAQSTGGLPLRDGYRVGFAYLMDTRTGKSKTFIDEACEMYEAGAIDGVLLFAPKGVYRNWTRTREDDPGEWMRHTPDHIYQHARIVEWRTGGGSKAHQKLLRELLDYRDGLRVLVMNTEAISFGEKAIKFAEAFASTLRSGLLGVDEAVDLGDPSSNRTKAVIGTKRQTGLRDMFTYRRILNGLLSPRSPLQVYSQFEILGQSCLGFHSSFSFRCRYAVTQRKIFGGRKVDVVVGYQNQDDLQRRVGVHSYRIRRDQCWDQPKTVYAQREVELTDEQERLYREVLADATARLEGDLHVTATAVITQILRLHQIACGHVVDELGHTHPVKSNRIAEMMREIEQTEDKVIVWSKYRPSVDDIVRALAEWAGDPLAVAQYHGGNVNDRTDELYRFQNDERCRYIVLTEAGAKGIKLTAAGTMIYFSNGYSLDKRSQSEDRPLGVDQKGAVRCVDLVACRQNGESTVDGRILKVLRERIDLSSAIMGDGYREWLL